MITGIYVSIQLYRVVIASLTNKCMSSTLIKILKSIIIINQMMIFLNKLTNHRLIKIKTNSCPL